MLVYGVFRMCTRHFLRPEPAPVPPSSYGSTFTISTVLNVVVETPADTFTCCAPVPQLIIFNRNVWGLDFRNSNICGRHSDCLCDHSNDCGGCNKQLPS